jgi:hypothetical protein
MTIYMATYEIIFVRHGYSCANATHAAIDHGRSTRYRDPELTAYGSNASLIRGADLRLAIRNVFGDSPYGIGSSCMIRAQQTAFLMLLRVMPGQGMHILPHIGEGGGGAAQQDDNTPLAPAAQRGIIPDVASRIDKDERNSSGAARHTPDDRASGGDHYSNFVEFVQWIQRTAGEGGIGPFFPRRPADPAGTATRRAVLFTHRGFLNRFFGIPNINNNDFFLVRFNIDTVLTGVAPIVTRLSNYGQDDILDKSLDGCARVPAAGGTRKKTRKSKGRKSRL